MSTAIPEIVDLDDESSWPEAVRTFVAGQAQRLAGSTEFTTDLSNELIERDEEFHALFPGRRLLAFHATSLFEHEIADIRRNGLRPLSPALVAQKIDEAHARGEISTLERDHCLARNVYEIDNVAGRGGRICLVVGRSIFDSDGGGLTPFLGGWGGESMNGGPGPHDDPVLQTLGRPSIVVATVDLGAPGNRPYAAPSLPKIFVGKRLGLEDAFGELHVTVNIRGEHILDIWHPGDPDYDRHLSLPRERANPPARPVEVPESSGG